MGRRLHFFPVADNGTYNRRREAMCEVHEVKEEQVGQSSGEQTNCNYAASSQQSAEGTYTLQT